MLKKIHIRNYKTLKDVEVELEPVTVFIGPNNSGKSNFFDALLTLREWVTTDKHLFNNDPFYCLYSDDNFISMDYTLKLPKNEFKHRMRWIKKPRNWEVDYEYERILENDIHIFPTFKFFWDDGKLAYNREGGDNPLNYITDDVRQLKKTQSGNYTQSVLTSYKEYFRDDIIGLKTYKIAEQCIRSINKYSFDPNSLRSLAETQSDKQKTCLYPEGSNIGAILSLYKEILPDNFDVIESALKNIVPEIDRILIDTIENQILMDNEQFKIPYKQIAIRERGQKIPAENISDGVLMIIALLTAIHAPEPASIICLEEPENYLHPWKMEQVVDAIMELAYPEDESAPKVQILLSTHSPILLDYFKEHLEMIRIVERDEEGCTSIKPIPEEKKKNIEKHVNGPKELVDLAHLALGDIWFTGILGGVPRDE